jgi:hypothetical protein
MNTSNKEKQEIDMRIAFEDIAEFLLSQGYEMTECNEDVIVFKDPKVKLIFRNIPEIDDEPHIQIKPY